MNLESVASLGYSGPELILGAGILFIIGGGLMVENKRRLGDLALLVVALSLVTAVGLRIPFSDLRIVEGLMGWGDGWLFSRMIVIDNFGLFFKILLLLAAFAVIWMSLGSNEVARTNQGEYYGLLLSSCLGMLYMAAASNLLMAYLSLEFVSLTSYVLAGYLKRDRRSCEAALKYLIYGGVASGTMIYGMSLLYGLAGSLDYAEIHDALAGGGHSSVALFFAVVFILAGMGYKIAAVPFHMWAPDVYEGAPIPITAFLSVGSKAAGFALLIRFFYPVLCEQVADGSWRFLGGVDWPTLMLVICMVTMTLGNLAALGQANLKRMLAYSSIAHAGYVLMGFVVLTDEGLTAMLFYLVAYYLMNLGAFLVVLVVANCTGREDLDGYRGLAWRGGAVPAVAMAIFLFSLTGIPPLVGFVGKFYLFAAVIAEHHYFLALVGILNSVISLYYYARVVKAMFLDEPEGGEERVTVGVHHGVLLGFLVAPTIFLGIYWEPVMRLATTSVRFFRG